MIKRLAHRNANVQLYTLEVREGIPSIVFDLAGNLNSVLLTRDTPAGQCLIPELWPQDPSRAGLEEFH